MTVFSNTDNQHNRLRYKTLPGAYFFITGIRHQVTILLKRPVTLGVQLRVQAFGQLTDLAPGYRGAAKSCDDFADLAGGNSLQIHLQHGGHEGLFASLITVEKPGAKLSQPVPIADQFQPANTCFETTGTGTIANTTPIRTLLMRPGIDAAIKFSLDQLL